MNIIINSGFNLTSGEFLSYFSVEIIYIVSIIINFVFYLFSLNHLKLRRYSNYLTCMTFAVNSVILAFFLFQNQWFTLFDDVFVFNSISILFKLFVNIFGFFFILATYKFVRKSHHKVPLLNAIFSIIVMLSGLLLSSDDFTFIYILLELIIILIYKYASNMRLKLNSLYSSTYITLSFCATFLFVGFYFLDYLVADLLQKSIMQSCMVLALLLKIGLFPVFNYSLDKKCKNNVAYSVLIFCLLPFIGAVAFNKIIVFCMFNEVCLMSATIFIVICALCASFSAFYSKKLSGFLIYLAQIYTCFYIANSICTRDINPGLMFTAILVLIGLYSMIRLYKNKKLYTYIFSGLLLFASILIPVFGCNILSNVLIYDKTGYFEFIAFVFCSILIIIKTFFILEGLYKK